ncbi:6,7-dimethyl-8-ribityllumazine synthase [Azospirillum rugosum]|uniref:6,7-dimethyl-8-ribityllumazine synthase n=1 Tax=Azospirillum rugosum TaxID=416170 RepID=A0ABS4SCH3_9PROT|nr:6,7-dimethyl-8-ribityllumazine synthase [Azospirillum rugosum]MBP2290268.1 6,7-dimethyl-8-ribityllumazine synthase [Azospirillum rugosum]MDQ0527744.1 6,7-dimethyl-8-ribityllumazine synthase [Azospirillum rugosum]
MAQIGLVLGRFHRQEAEDMLAEARDVAARLGLQIAAETWVPGSMETPLAVKRLLRRPEVAGVAALGIIERGETSHGLVMGHAVIKSLIDLQLEFMKPVGVGILGPDIHPSQIPSRVRPYAAAAVEAIATMLTE